AGQMLRDAVAGWNASARPPSVTKWGLTVVGEGMAATAPCESAGLRSAGDFFRPPNHHCVRGRITEQVNQAGGMATTQCPSSCAVVGALGSVAVREPMGGSIDVHVSTLCSDLSRLWHRYGSVRLVR